MSQLEQFREQCAKTIELCDDAMMAHDDYVLDPSECAGIVRTLPLPEVMNDAEALRKENEQLISIAKRWLAIGGCAWNVSRYENEKDRLENDTKAVIAALKGGIA